MRCISCNVIEEGTKTVDFVRDELTFICRTCRAKNIVGRVVSKKNDISEYFAICAFCSFSLTQRDGLTSDKIKYRAKRHTLKTGHSVTTCYSIETTHSLEAVKV